METIKIDLHTPTGAPAAVSTYYYNKDIIITTPDIKCVVVTDILFDDIYKTDKCTTVETTIEDGKIPAFTPVVLYGPTNTEYIEAEVQDTNKFQSIDTCLFGVLTGRGIDTAYNDYMRFYALSFDKDTKKFVFELVAKDTIKTIPDNFVLLPTLSKFDKSTSKTISTYKNLDDLSKYYQAVSGLIIDFKKLFDDIKGKSDVERKLIYEHLLYNIIRINSRDDFDRHMSQEGKYISDGPSFISKLLYVVIMCMAR